MGYNELSHMARSNLFIMRLNLRKFRFEKKQTIQTHPVDDNSDKYVSLLLSFQKKRAKADAIIGREKDVDYDGTMLYEIEDD